MTMFYDIIYFMLKTELYLNKTIKYGLYAILLTPLVFLSKALYPFGTPKFILFQILVEIVFAAWLILRLSQRENIDSVLPPHSPSLIRRGLSGGKNYIAISLFLFIAVSFISAIFGVDFQRSFWGIGARMTGLFAELHFLAWFLILVNSFSNPNKKNNPDNPNGDINPYNYLNFSFFVALAVAATGFYQHTEGGKIWAFAYGSTVFNNPTFAAPYLIFHFFWGLYQTIFNLQISIYKLKGWIFGAGSALIFFVILLGQVRGAILGSFAGILLLGIFLLFSDAASRRFKISLVAAFAMIFIGFLNLWIFRDSQFIQNQNITILKRLTQFSLSEATAQTRFLTWQIALKGFGEKPLLGVGPENFNYLFNANYNPRLLKFGGGGFEETWFDKPHNAFLEILAETGIIGSLAYILLWLAVVLTLFKLFKTGRKILTFILASAFVAYLGSVFFSFDSFGSWFGLYLFLAFLASNYYNSTNDTNSYANGANKNHWVKNLFALFVCAGLFVLLNIQYGILRANATDADALMAFPLNPGQGIALFKKSLTYFSPYKSEYQFDLIASVAGAVEKGIPLPNLEDTVNFALSEADKAVAAHPKDAAKYTDMVRIYNIFGTRGRDPEILVQAEAFGNKSLKLSPQRQETLYYLARTALLKGNPGLAVRLTKNAVDIEPSINLSHWYFGLALIGNSQRQEGATEIKKALELGYRPKNQTEEGFIKNLGL